MSAVSCWPSPSMNTRMSPVAARAPRLIAAPLPIEYGEDRQSTPLLLQMPRVSSVEPSSTTMISASGCAARRRGSSAASAGASFLAGRMMLRRFNRGLPGEDGIIA